MKTLLTFPTPAVSACGSAVMIHNADETGNPLLIRVNGAWLGLGEDSKLACYESFEAIEARIAGNMLNLHKIEQGDVEALAECEIDGDKGAAMAEEITMDNGKLRAARRALGYASVTGKPNVFWIEIEMTEDSFRMTPHEVK